MANKTVSTALKLMDSDDLERMCETHEIFKCSDETKAELIRLIRNSSLKYSDLFNRELKGLLEASEQSGEGTNKDMLDRLLRPARAAAPVRPAGRRQPIAARRAPLSFRFGSLTYVLKPSR